MKENRDERRGYAAALQRKQAVAASQDSAQGLPRVAALPVRASSRLRNSVSDRPLSSLRNVGPNTVAPRAAARRLGCKPATHSERLVPLTDATARGLGAAAAPTAASRSTTAAPAASRSTTAAPAPSTSTAIGDPTLDVEEAALQAELEALDLDLRRSQMRSATPEPSHGLSAAAVGAAPAAHLGGVVLGVPAPVPALTPASLAATATPATAPAAAASSHAQPQPPQPEPQSAPRVLAQVPAPHPQEPQVPPQDQSIVRTVVTATGTGCRDVIAAHAGAALHPGACWTSRGHRVLSLESSCILQLWGRRTPDVTLRLTFADASSVPAVVRLEHAPTPTAAFERLGDIKLQPKSLTQLKHLFRLGKGLELQRCLRISLLGHIAADNSGAHRVTHMLLTSGQGPQRSQSALSSAAAAGVDPLSARSAQASVNHSAPGSGAPAPGPRATADSAASGAPAPSEHSAAAAPAAAPAEPPRAEPAAVAVEPARQSLSAASQPRVPPLPLASLSLGAADSAAAAAPVPEAVASAGGEEQLEQAKLSWRELPGHQVEGTVWGQLQGVPASLDYQALAEEFAPPASAATAATTGAAAPSTSAGTAGSGGIGAAPAAAATARVLPAERCAAVGATLARLGLAPAAARDVLLHVLEPERSVSAPLLGEEQAAELLECLPSAEERRALSAHAGPPAELTPGEQFMLAASELPALDLQLQAWRFRSQLASRAQAVSSAAALLSAACEEVQRSEALRAVLKIALLAGNFLNAGNEGGAAAGFQIDALLKLKDVRSSRARSRTLLHFVAREAARQLPGGASLAAELPSAAAAAQLDLAAVQGELRELTAEARLIKSSLVASSRFRALQAFRSEVLERLAGLQAGMDEAEAAFRRLGGFINGQRSTLAAPGAFFGVLATVASELEAAHEENAAADAEAEAAGSGRKPRRAGSQGGHSPTASAASGATRRQRSSAPQGSLLGSAVAAAASSEVRRSTADSGGAAAASAASAGRRHSPSPVLSKAAVSSLGGSRRGEGEAGPSGTGSPPPAASSVDVASLLSASRAGSPSEQQAQRHQAQQRQQAQQQEGPAGGQLSSPVANLLRESARLISSVDHAGPANAGSGSPASCGGSRGGGFGSAIIPDAAAASQASGGSAARDTASTPDGAVQSAPLESEGAYSTPRGGAASRLVQPLPAGHQGVAADVGGAAQAWHPRYRAPTSTEEEAPQAAPAAAAERPSAAGAAADRGLGQLRQRSLQQLSPTSTPLSSLGRQSSRSSIYSSDAGGSTPGSSLRFRGSLLRRSSSPLGPLAPPPDAAAPGLGAAVAEAEAAAFGGRATAAALAAAGGEARGGGVQQQQQQQRADHPAHVHSGDPLSPPCPHCAAAVQQQAQLAAAVQQLAGRAAAAAAAMYASTSDEDSQLGASPAATAAEEEAAAAAEALAQARPPRGFGALHSRASSVDLAFFAPFTVGQLGEGALQGEQAAEQGLRSSFIVGQGSGEDAWGPLAAQQERLEASTGWGGMLRHRSNSMDDLALPRSSGGAGSVNGGGGQPAPARAAFSLPASPTHQGRAARPLALNLAGLSGRLQAYSRSADAAHARGGVGAGAAASRQPQLSPVLEALLGSVPTPAPPGGPGGGDGAGGQHAAELAADDLADMAGCSSDHEAEWAALEQLEAQEERWARQQLAEREAREQALLQRPGAPQQWAPQWGAHAPQPQPQQQLRAGQGAQQSQQQLLEQQQQRRRLEQQLHIEEQRRRLEEQQRAREPTPEWTHRDQLDGWLAAAAAGQPGGPVPQRHRHQDWHHQQSVEEGAEEAPRQPGLRPALLQPPPEGEQAELAALGALPSPITSATSDLDRAVAALLASAGNTPTGPLGHHRRAASLGAAAAEALAQQVVLLEPVMPAPLGEGVRASHRMAEGLPAEALRRSVTSQRAMLRPGSAASAAPLPAALSAPATTLSAEAAAWAAEQAAMAEQRGAAGSLGGSHGGALEWDGGPGPVRRRGWVHKLLSKKH